MLMLAGLIVCLMVAALIWDMAGQPTPWRLLRQKRGKRRRNNRILF